MAWRDLTPSPTERELNPHRMKHLREKADAQQLVTFHWAKALFDGKPVRVNGQHSATMLCELDGNFPANLMAHIDEYQVETIDGLAMLFRQFDDRTSGRSPSDVAGAYQNLYPALRDVKKPVGKLGIQGVVWYRRHVIADPGVPSGDDRYKLFNVVDLQHFLVWLNGVLDLKTPELKREPVIAAIYATFIANEREARPFWETVARGGTDFDEDDPTTVLDTWLKETKEERGAEKIPPGKFFQACIYAWNAAREHKPIKAIKVDTKKAWLQPHAD
jgi:hypothetical protein